MTISVKHDFSLRPVGGGLANDRDRMPKSAFASVLTEAMMNGGSRSNKQARHEPLSGAEIAALIMQMQQQVNDHLFRVLAEDDDRENWISSSPEAPANAFHAPFGLAPAFPGTHGQASKIQRSPQNNDGLPSSVALEQIIHQAADAYGVDENLIRSVIRAESNFENHSTSPRGAMGLMQLMPDTARELGVRDAYNPQENIMGGTKYLKSMLDRYGGDTRLALAAYNWGMGNVERHPGRLPQETRDYIARVTRYYQDARA